MEQVLPLEAEPRLTAATLTPSPLRRPMRAITGGMSANEPKPAKSRTRPPSQAAQVILRMSEPQRELLHAVAKSAGLSAVKYVLDLVAADARERRVECDPAVLLGMFANAEGPRPMDETPHAEARRAVTAAAG